MADRYWVGGTGDWDDTAHWSASSGGAGGETAPTSSDNVIFNSASHNDDYTVTHDTGNGTTLDLTITRPTGKTVTFSEASASTGLTIHGSLTINSTAGVAFTGTAHSIRFLATTAGHTITTNGITLPAILFNGADGGWTTVGTTTVTAALNVNNGNLVLGGALVVGTTLTLPLVTGSFDSNENSITCNVFQSNSSNTRTVTVENSSITIGTANTTATILAMAATNLTWNATNTTWFITRATTNTATFAGAGLAFGHSIIYQNSSPGRLTITGSNSCNNFVCVTPGAIVRTTAGTTQTFGDVTITGAAGNHVVLESSTTSAFTWAKSGGGTITMTYATVSYMTGSPADTWFVENGTNSGNNINVTFLGGAGAGGGTRNARGSFVLRRPRRWR